MANHGGVHTRKKMTPEAITALLAEVNTRVFKGILKIAYHKDSESYGPHLWEITYGKYCHRFCWLETSHRWEIRHHASDFEWWIDTVVTNEVAVVFNGKVWDDGVEETWAGEPNKYDRLIPYLKRSIRSNGMMAKLCLHWKLKQFPKVLR